MEVKKIVEGMTAPEVAQVIDENFKALNNEKANKSVVDAKFELLVNMSNQLETEKADKATTEENFANLEETIATNKESADTKLSELGSKVNGFEFGEKRYGATNIRIGIDISSLEENVDTEWVGVKQEIKKGSYVRALADTTGSDYFFPYAVFSKETGKCIDAEKRATGSLVLIVRQYDEDVIVVVNSLKSSNHFLMEKNLESEYVEVKEELKDSEEKIKGEVDEIYQKHIALETNISELNGGFISRDIEFPNKGKYQEWYSGKLGEASNFEVSDYIDVSGVISIKFSDCVSKTNTVSGGTCFFDETKKWLAGVPAYGGGLSLGYKERELIIPENAKYVRFERYNDIDGFYYQEQRKGRIVEIEEEIGRIVGNELTIYDNDVEWVLGFYLPVSSGVPGEGGATYKVSDFIDVKGCTSVEFMDVSSTSSTPSGGTCFYDKDKVYISGIRAFGGSSVLGYKKRTVEIPTDACYVRFEGLQTRNDFFYRLINGGKIDRLVHGVGDVLSLNDRVETVANIQSMKKGRIKNSTQQTPPLMLLHFSDTHQDEENLSRIIAFKEKFKEYVDDSICTGDLVKVTLDDGMEFWDNVEGSSDVIITTGNHEYARTINGEAVYNKATTLEVYNLLYKNRISKWGVVQPIDAESLGLCYFYKDYSKNKLRFIVLDINNIGQDYLNNQLTWFNDTLQSSLTLGYSVVIAQHYPFNKTESLKCSFANSNIVNNWEIYEGEESWKIRNAFANAVDTFIENGGDFVCWLAGHTHQDSIGVSATNKNQLCINISCAMLSDAYSDDIRTKGERSQDLFNLVSVDTESKVITILRIGSNVNRFMWRRHSLCINYSTKEILWND